MRFFSEQIFASTVSNMLGIIIGHPLDTVKVRKKISINHEGANANGPFLEICYEMSQGDSL